MITVVVEVPGFVTTPAGAWGCGGGCAREAFLTAAEVLGFAEFAVTVGAVGALPAGAGPGDSVAGSGWCVIVACILVPDSASFTKFSASETAASPAPAAPAAMEAAVRPEAAGAGAFRVVD